MNKSYQDPKAGQEYKEFSDSIDGQQQHQLVLKAIMDQLPADQSKILDAGCGDGWLVDKLNAKYTCQGCDISEVLIQEAQKKYPQLDFKIADLSQPLPYPLEHFDVAILSLVLHNVEQQIQALTNINKILKLGGKLLIISINPYYAFPVAFWRRSFLDFFLRRKATLRLNSYNYFLKQSREHNWKGKSIPLRFSPLSEQINAGLAAGFRLERIQELKSEADSQQFDFNYRLYRFPLLVMMEFRK